MGVVSPEIAAMVAHNVRVFAIGQDLNLLLDNIEILSCELERECMRVHCI